MDKLDSALGLLAQVRSDVMALGKEASERADILDARVKELEAALRVVDDDVRHHLRSDEIAPALIRTHAVKAVRDVLGKR